MIYGYVRVSTEKQRDNYSVDVQRKRIKDFADIIQDQYRIYDDVKSGKSLNRPEMQKMLADIVHDDYPIKRVWSIELTRLARDVRDGADLAKIFVENKVELYIKDDKIDLTDSSSMFTYNINMAVAAHERAKTIERVKRTKAEVKDQGKAVYNILYGYKCEYEKDGKKKWVIEQSEAIIIRKVYDMYSNGHSTISIAKYMNEQGVKSFKGCQFYAKTVRMILRKPQYFGLTKNTKNVLIPSATYEAILEFTYEEWQKKIETREPLRSIPKILVTYPTSGLIRCGYCGCGYYIDNNRRSYGVRTTFWHDNKIKTENWKRHSIPCEQPQRVFKAQPINEIIENLFLLSIQSTELITKYKRDKTLIDMDIIKYATDNYQTVQEKTATKIKKERIIESVADGDISSKDARFILEKLDEQLRTIQDKIHEQNLILLRLKKQRSQSSQEYADEFKTKYLTGNMKEKRNMLGQIFDSCIIKDFSLTITRIDGEVFNYNLN